MVWRADGPQGFESSKVAFDLVPYFHGRCLDLGCGPKKIFPSKNIIGIDSGKDFGLFGVPSNPDIAGSCEKLDMFADGSMDCVFSSHLIEHIEDYEAALREWWRVVKVGGYLIIYCPHADWYPNIGMPGSNPDHKHDFRNEDMRAAMQRVALEENIPDWRYGWGWDLIVDEVRTQEFEYSLLQIYRKRDDFETHVVPPAPKPEKSLGLVRLGAFGDALWITTVLPALKAEGWHITLYTQHQGETSLRHDPHIDRIIVQPHEIFGGPSEAAPLQGAYWLHCEKKHDRFINLVGSVERHLLPHTSDPNFYLPAEQRRRLMNENYCEAVAKWAGIEFHPRKVKVRFTPSRDEIAWACAKRAEWAQPFVVINPTGSSLPKWWPHVQQCMELLSAAGVGGVVVGELRGVEYTPPAGWQVVGTQWDLRKVYTLAAMADVVIGTESAVINSVAHEPPLKVVLLSHSTGNNLTRDWDRTVALEPEGLDCYPCHRIHGDWTYCTRVPENNSAACQNAATAELVAGYALDWIRHGVLGELKEAA